MKDTIKFADFAKVDLRVGKVVDCTKKEGSDKLLKLTVDLNSNDENGKKTTKTIFTGLANYYEPKFFIGKEFVFVVNLEPRKMMDEISEGMLLAAEGEKPIPVIPLTEVQPGTSLV